MGGSVAFFHGRKGGGVVWVTRTWYSEIDMRENNGLGALTLMQPLVQDTLRPGRFTAVRHGNGRDWWILMERNCQKEDGCKNNFFYTILLTPNGVETSPQPLSQDIVTDVGAGQAVFTPDGTKYLVSQNDLFDEPYLLDIYDFDRCTGELSNKKQITSLIATRNNGGGGVVVSPNSRFAYLIMSQNIVQYDLWADDIKASEVIVAKYDGFIDIFPTGFLFGQLAPDGKIYICTTNGTRYLHVIHHPNEKGLLCNVEQHGIKLPTFNGFSIPNHPNYRLGAWEGSACDTLSDLVSSEGGNECGSEGANEGMGDWVTVFPNPVAWDLYVEGVASLRVQALEVRIYSMMGQLMLRVLGQDALDVSDLENGIYVVEVWHQGQVIGREKVVVAR